VCMSLRASGAAEATNMPVRLEPDFLTQVRPYQDLAGADRRHG
jgi:hypothetical protein